MRAGWVLLWLSAVPAALLRFDRAAALAWQEGGLVQLRSALAALSSRFAFPLCDLLFFALCASVLGCLLSRRRAPLPYLAAGLVLSLSLTWGAPCALSESAPQPDAQELFALCLVLSQEAADVRPASLAFDRAQIAREAARLCQSAVTPKAALFPGLMKALGLAGWWSPLTSEAVVDLSMGALNLPFALCHELMHAAGVAGEAQAHFLAYQACMRGDGVFRYSAAMNALWHAMRALRAMDGAAWEEVLACMDEAVLHDLARMNGLSEPDGGPLQRAQDLLTGLYQHITGSEPYDAFAGWLAQEKFA